MKVALPVVLSFFFVLGIIFLECLESSSEIALHLEYEDEVSHFSTDEIQEELFLWRGLKSAKSSRKSSKSRAKRNCYGDRCEKEGGESLTNIILGCVVGLWCCISTTWWILNKCKLRFDKQDQLNRKKHAASYDVTN